MGLVPPTLGIVVDASQDRCLLRWAPVLTPHGVLTLGAADEPWPFDPARGLRLETAFARGAGHGLLLLGADEVGTALPRGAVLLARIRARAT